MSEPTISGSIDPTADRHTLVEVEPYQPAPEGIRGVPGTPTIVITMPNREDYPAGLTPEQVGGITLVKVYDGASTLTDAERQQVSVHTFMHGIAAVLSDAMQAVHDAGHRRPDVREN